MADTSAQAEIRGIAIDRIARGYADEVMVMKKFVTISPTSARQVRWYQMTAGIYSTTDTTTMTTARLSTDFKARPESVEPSFTRNTSYVLKWMLESPLISNEDIDDNDPELWMKTIDILTRAVSYEVDRHIWDVITESRTAVNINTVTIVDEWDDPANATPVQDIMEAKEEIANYNYDISNCVLMITPSSATDLMNWIIAQKGANVPDFASQKIVDGVVTSFLGCQVVVSNVVTSDYACVFVPMVACTYKQFKPISTAIVEEPAIGKKFRVYEEGIALLTDPKAVTLLDNIGPT